MKISHKKYQIDEPFLASDNVLNIVTCVLFIFFLESDFSNTSSIFLYSIKLVELKNDQFLARNCAYIFLLCVSFVTQIERFHRNSTLLTLEVFTARRIWLDILVFNE